MFSEVLTEEQEAKIAEYLRQNEYESVEDWARDSDYLLTDCCGWVDLNDDPVDPVIQLWYAIEASEGRG